MSLTLRANVKEYRLPDYPEVIFWLRGLTISEMFSLNEIIEQSNIIPNSIFYRIGITCLVGWDHMYVEREGELYSVSCNANNIEECLTHQDVTTLGKIAFSELSQVSDLEESKYKGYVNFVFHISDEKKGKANRESFNCEECARKGLIMSRPCGRPDRDKLRDEFYGKTRKKEVKTAIEIARSQFGIKGKLKRAGKELSKEEQEEKKKLEEERKKGIMINGFRFVECPVTWLTPSVKTLGEALWDCAKNNKTFFSGGVSDQSYKIYQIEKIVSSESNRLEAEEMKRLQSK
jgi:hypothetical protein